MKYKILISEDAKKDLLETKDYYSNINPALYKKCISDIFQTVDHLKENPLLYQIKYREIRIALTKKFPFGIHYIIEDSTIFILRILHTKRFFKD